ncbi:MAG: hypothetical protein QM775_27795 [Pirellulales bacterium]
MLRSNASNPNEITFVLKLDTDPRYKPILQSFRKDIVDANTSVVESLRATTSTAVQTVQKIVSGSTASINTMADKSIEQLRATHEAWKRKMDAFDRVRQNLESSANSRAASRPAIARDARYIALREIGESRQPTAREYSAQTYYGRMNGLSTLPGDLSGALTANSRLMQGLSQTTHGVIELTRAMAIFGLSTEESMERAVRRLAAVESAIHAVSGVVNIGRGIASITSAGGGMAGGIAGGGGVARAAGAGATLLSRIGGIGLRGLAGASLPAAAIATTLTGVGVLAHGLLTMPTAAERAEYARRQNADFARMELNNIEAMREAARASSGESMRLGDLAFNANLMTARGSSERLNTIRDYRRQIGIGIFSTRQEMANPNRFAGLSDAYAAASREEIGARQLSLRERDLDLAKQERDVFQEIARTREHAGLKDIRAAQTVLESAKQSLEIAARRKAMVDEQYDEAAIAFGRSTAGQRAATEIALRRHRAGEVIKASETELLSMAGLGDIAREASIRRGERAGFAGSGIGQFMRERQGAAGSAVTVAAGVAGAASSGLEFVTQLNAKFADQLRAKLKERDEEILEAAGRLANEISDQKIRKLASEILTQQLAKAAVENQSG